MSSLKTTDNASVRPKIRNKCSEKLIGEPLERRSIRFEDRDGIERYYPALHIRFSHTMIFTKYYRPPMKIIADSKMNRQDLQNNDAINKWMANVIAFEEMIKTLLRLQHNQFWSTLVHEKSLQISLESYLRSAPRDHDLHNFLLTDQMKAHIKRIHILVFKLYLRICSFAESKTNFITETTYGTLIYDNYLMDVTKIIDLCVLYSNTSYSHLLSRMLSNVIQCQNRYKEDLLKGCATICNALFSVQQKIGPDDSQFERNNKLSYFQWSDLQSLVTQITDISVSLEAVLQMIPEMSQLFKNSSMDKSIVDFYNRVFPSLQNELNKRLNSIENNDLLVEQNKRQITISRSHLLIAFRQIIENCFLNKLLDKNLKVESKVRLTDELVETLTLAAFEKGFIIDYSIKYPIERDFEELSKHSETTHFESFDKTRIDYLKNIVQSTVSLKSKSQIGVTSNKNEEKVNGFLNTEEMAANNIELESSIQYIQEIMPELGPIFIEKCLKYFDWDNEKVLNAILENNLPPHLDSLDRTLQKTEKNEINAELNKVEKLIVRNGGDIPENQLPEVIDSRDNVFNNDEFDIFRNKNIDLSRIHSGKRDLKPEPKIDNQFKEKIMNLHHKTLEEEENKVEQPIPWIENNMDYNDEYDDTYEDDTNIDLPNDKLMDELDQKPDTKEDNSRQKSIHSNDREGYNHRNRNKYRNYR